MFSDQCYISNWVLFVDNFSLFWTFIYSTVNKRCLEIRSCVCGNCRYGFFCASSHSELFLTCPFFEKLIFIAERLLLKIQKKIQNTPLHSSHSEIFFRTHSILRSRILGECRGNAKGTLIGTLQECVPCWFFC